MGDAGAHVTVEAEELGEGAAVGVQAVVESAAGEVDAGDGFETTAMVLHTEAAGTKVPPAIHWTSKRTKTLLEFLLAHDCTAFDESAGARWPTFGDLRRRPPSGGEKGMY